MIPVSETDTYTDDNSSNDPSEYESHSIILHADIHATGCPNIVEPDRKTTKRPSLGRRSMSTKRPSLPRRSNRLSALSPPNIVDPHLGNEVAKLFRSQQTYIEAKLDSIKPVTPVHSKVPKVYQKTVASKKVPTTNSKKTYKKKVSTKKVPKNSRKGVPKPDGNPLHGNVRRTLTQIFPGLSSDSSDESKKGFATLVNHVETFVKKNADDPLVDEDRQVMIIKDVILDLYPKQNFFHLLHRWARKKPLSFVNDSLNAIKVINDLFPQKSLIDLLFEFQSLGVKPRQPGEKSAYLPFNDSTDKRYAEIVLRFDVSTDLMYTTLQCMTPAFLASLRMDSVNHVRNFKFPARGNHGLSVTAPAPPPHHKTKKRKTIVTISTEEGPVTDSPVGSSEDEATSEDRPVSESPAAYSEDRPVSESVAACSNDEAASKEHPVTESPVSESPAACSNDEAASKEHPVTDSPVGSSEDKATSEDRPVSESPAASSNDEAASKEHPVTESPDLQCEPCLHYNLPHGYDLDWEIHLIRFVSSPQSNQTLGAEIHREAFPMTANCGKHPTRGNHCHVKRLRKDGLASQCRLQEGDWFLRPMDMSLLPQWSNGELTSGTLESAIRDYETTKDPPKLANFDEIKKGWSKESYPGYRPIRVLRRKSRSNTQNTTSHSSKKSEYLPTSRHTNQANFEECPASKKCCVGRCRDDASSKEPLVNKNPSEERPFTESPDDAAAPEEHPAEDLPSNKNNNNNLII